MIRIPALMSVSAAAVLTCAGCQTPAPPAALIHYTQLGACTQAQLPDGTQISAPPSHAIVIFIITNIDNTQTAINWTFTPNTLEVDPVSAPQSNLGTAQPNVPIAANTNVQVNAPVGIMVATVKQDGSDAATYSYILVYPNVSPAPGTISINDTGSTQGLPFATNCNQLVGG